MGTSVRAAVKKVLLDQAGGRTPLRRDRRALVAHLGGDRALPRPARAPRRERVSRRRVQVTRALALVALRHRTRNRTRLCAHSPAAAWPAADRGCDGARRALLLEGQGADAAR